MQLQCIYKWQKASTCTVVHSTLVNLIDYFTVSSSSSQPQVSHAEITMAKKMQSRKPQMTSQLFIINWNLIIDWKTWNLTILISTNRLQHVNEFKQRYKYHRHQQTYKSELGMCRIIVVVFKRHHKQHDEMERWNNTSSMKCQYK